LMATRTDIPGLLRRFQTLQSRLGDLFRRQSKMLVKLLVRRAGAKTGHADKSSGRADDGVPALADAGFDRDIDLGLADDRRALRLRRGEKQFEARHRNDPRR